MINNITTGKKTALPKELIAVAKRHGVAMGDKLRCKIAPNKREHAPEKWFAREVICESRMKWLPWQVGEEALALTLPNTSPGSDHDGICLACWKCGWVAIGPQDIFKLKHTCVWTKTIRSPLLAVDSQKTYNECKKCFVQRVSCSTCKNLLGSYYETSYEGCSEETPFPCFKLITSWERRKWDGDKPSMAMVLVGDQSTVREKIAKLEVSEEWEMDKLFQGGGRVDRHTFQIMETAKKAMKAQEEAERRAEEAERSAKERAAEAELTSKRAAEAEQLAKAKAAEVESTSMRAEKAEQELAEAKAAEDKLTKKLADAKISAKSVVWECSLGGVWLRYPSDVSKLLERMFAEHKKAHFSLDDRPYEIDFSEKNMMQINVETRYRREVRRREVQMPTRASEQVIWECEVDGSWLRYPAEVEETLNAEFELKGKANFALLGKVYEVDFGAGEDEIEQTNIATRYKRKVRRRERTVASVAPPKAWAPHPDGQNCVMVTLRPTSKEWEDIEEKMMETMPRVNVVTVQRVQNLRLWEYFCFRKERAMKLSGGGDPNVVSVWHGTRDTDPLVICEDEADGFMMQYSREGMWGRGVYFAQNANYSSAYAYKSTESVGFFGTQTETRKSMILARLVSGEEIHISPDNSLKACPEKSQGKGRYDTVTGRTKGSKVYVVYENGRAYPQYLVTYTE